MSQLSVDNSAFTPEDALRLERNLQVYDKIATSMMASGIPKDREDRQFLMDALSGSNKVILSKAKLKSDAKAADSQKAAAELAAQILLKTKGHRFDIPSDVEDAEVVRRETPKLSHEIAPVSTVQDETFVGTQNLRFEDFEERI